MTRQIILRHLDKPPLEDHEEDLRWFCNSMGFGSGRDTEKVATAIIATLLRRYAREPGIPVDEIAADLAISEARVNHHVRHFLESGILFRRKKLVCIRGNSLCSLVREIRKDADRIFDDLEEAAAEIDALHGIPSRPK